MHREIGKDARITHGLSHTFAAFGAYAPRTGELRILADSEQLARASALGRSLELQSDPEVLLARGRAYQRLNNLDDAVTDYERANSIVPSPQAAAAAAYAHNLRFEHEHAARLYRQVIALGCATPVVYNDLGFSLVQMNRAPEAKPYFDLAIRHDPGLQAAYCNRAIADYPHPGA